ncbi:MAG: thioredoxin family protein [Acidobacteria bacterium]|nr:thioredoxin family protein [Acidobacteriota bacterium]
MPRLTAPPSAFRLWFTALVLVASVLPASAQLRRIPVEIVPIAESDRLRAGTSIKAALQVTLPEGLHVQSNKPRDPALIPTELILEPPTGITGVEVVFPKAVDFPQEGLPEPLLVFEREFTIGVQFALAADLAPGSHVVPFELRYQACDDRVCFAPTSKKGEWVVEVVAAGAAVTAVHQDVLGAIAFGSGETPAVAAPVFAVPPPAAAAATGDGLAQLDAFTVVATTGGYLGVSDFKTFVSNAEAGIVETGLFEGRGPLAILLLVLIGGLALNLTPCVLPMIPINLAIIGAGAQAGSRQRGFLLGLTYGGAMAFVYGVLGLIVVLTASTFGTINASPWFNLGIAVLFIGLALAMFDVFEIDFSRFAGTVGSGSARGSFGLAFTMGTVAALLAGACVAPVVIQVVLFASNLYATGTSAALALPFFLGIGMAIPWPIAGAGLASLPKPGPWMVRVKQAFGVLILGTAVYYGYLAYGLFANQWVDAAEVSSSVEEKLKAGWHSSLAEGLAVAEREGKPVLIDMWATWCKNCLTMDKTTLADSEVKAALEGYVKIKVQAEQPDEPPSVDLMKRFKAVGLPAYAIIRPTSKPSVN